MGKEGTRAGNANRELKTMAKCIESTNHWGGGVSDFNL